MTLSNYFLNFVLIFLILKSVSPSILCSYADSEKTIANCANLKLREVPSQLNSHLTRLDLPYNELMTLSENDFVPYPHLKHLQLQSNKISSIHQLTFLKTQFLTSLYLNQNSFKILSFSVPRSLERINARSCGIRSIDPAFFDGLKFLESVDLSNNLLNELPDDLFRGVRVQSIELSVDFSSNNLRGVKASSVKSLINGSASYSQLRLYLNENPIHCNCLMRWVSQFTSNPSVGPTQLDVQGTCSSPLELQGIRVRDVPGRMMKCEAPLIQNEREVFLFSEHTEKAVVRCEATGDPTPYVFFQVKSVDAVLLPGQKLGRFSVDFEGNLRISKVRMEDAGAILCIAGNVVQNTTGILSIEVSGALSQSETAAIVSAVMVFISILLLLLTVFLIFKCCPCCPKPKLSNLCRSRCQSSQDSIENFKDSSNTFGRVVHASSLSTANITTSTIHGLDFDPEERSQVRLERSLREFSKDGFQQSANQRSLLNQSLTNHSTGSRNGHPVRYQPIRSSDIDSLEIVPRRVSEASEHSPSNQMNGNDSLENHNYQNLPNVNTNPNSNPNYQPQLNPPPDISPNFLSPDGNYEDEDDPFDEIQSNPVLFCAAKLPGDIQLFPEPEEFLSNDNPLTSTTGRRKKKEKSSNTDC